MCVSVIVLQLVVVFELFLPLVLFVILLLIRKKLPADPVQTSKLYNETTEWMFIDYLNT